MDELKNNRFKDLSEREKFFAFFTLDKIDDLEEISRGNEVLEKVLEKLKILSDDYKFINMLERDQIEEYARRVAQAQEKKESEEIGFKKGEKIKQVEIANNLLKNNVDINIISDSTGLSIEEINNI